MKYEEYAPNKNICKLKLKLWKKYHYFKVLLIFLCMFCYFSKPLRQTQVIRNIWQNFVNLVKNDTILYTSIKLQDNFGFISHRDHGELTDNSCSLPDRVLRTRYFVLKKYRPHFVYDYTGTVHHQLTRLLCPKTDVNSWLPSVQKPGSFRVIWL